MRSVRIVVAVLICALATLLSGGPAAGADNAECSGGSVFSGGTEVGAIEIGGQQCDAPTPSTGGGTTPVSSEPVTRTFDCGPPSAAGSGLPNADVACGFVANACAVPPGTPIPPNVTTTVTQRQDPTTGEWQRVGYNCAAVPGAAPPPPAVITAAMVRQEIVKLLPPVEVGVAPADGPTLVNMETVVWAPTAAQRPLGPVTILGQQVAITIRFDHASYDFGDGATATTTTPGTPWSRTVCDTAQCPTLDGHTYTATAAQLTVTSTIAWTATFTVAGGPEQPIPGTIDGPAAQHPLQVLEGRAILVR